MTGYDEPLDSDVDWHELEDVVARYCAVVDEYAWAVAEYEADTGIDAETVENVGATVHAIRDRVHEPVTALDPIDFVIVREDQDKEQYRAAAEREWGDAVEELHNTYRSLETKRRRLDERAAMASIDTDYD